jgi:hypothetical protein
MLTRLAVVTIGVAAVLGGCAKQAGPAPAAPLATAPSAAKPAPVIVRLVSRRYTIVVSAGRVAPIYHVTNSAGQVVADGVTLEQLQLVDNTLYQELVPAIAPNARADASLEGPLIGVVDKR